MGSGRSHTSTRQTLQNFSVADNLSQAAGLWPPAPPLSSPRSTRGRCVDPRPNRSAASLSRWLGVSQDGAGQLQSLSRVRAPPPDPAGAGATRSGWGLPARGSLRQRRRDAGAWERWPPRGWRTSTCEVRGGPPGGAGGGSGRRVRPGRRRCGRSAGNAEPRACLAVSPRAAGLRAGVSALGVWSRARCPLEH